MRKILCVGLLAAQMLLVACSSGDDVDSKTSDKGIANPLYGKWKMESMQDRHGEVGLPEGDGDGYIEFSPNKMVIRDGNEVNTINILSYAVEDGRVALTAEARGEQKIVQYQILDNDRVKMVKDEGTGENIILRRVGNASSK